MQPGRKEIVAVKIGDVLTTDPVLILEAAERGGIPLHYMARGMFRYLAKIETDKELKLLWNKLASGPALFIIEEDGTMHGPSSFSLNNE